MARQRVVAGGEEQTQHSGDKEYCEDSSIIVSSCWISIHMSLESEDEGDEEQSTP